MPRSEHCECGAPIACYDCHGCVECCDCQEEFDFDDDFDADELGIDPEEGDRG